jgi:hypothetical protein
MNRRIFINLLAALVTAPALMGFAPRRLKVEQDIGTIIRAKRRELRAQIMAAEIDALETALWEPNGIAGIEYWLKT